jgi:hypothetical protein
MKKDLADKLEKYAKYCLFAFLVLIVIYLLIPIVMPSMIQNDVLGFREVFGCDPSKVWCCEEGFNKTVMISWEEKKDIFYPDINGDQVGLGLCPGPGSILSMLAMILLIVGVILYAASWIKKKK